MIWCILWPLIVGLICALLGYLLGRLLAKGNDNSEKISQLEADLDACNKSKLSLKKQGDDLNIWREKVSKLEADLSASKTTNLTATSNNELELWKNKVASLRADLEACKASNLALEAKSKVAKTAVSLIPFDGDAAKAVFGKKIKQDDLKVVEGIGPKIEGLFHSFDIKTWKALSEASVEKCQEVLDSGGDRYKIHNPGTWPKQAELAYEGKWAALLKWQDELDGGKA